MIKNISFFDVEDYDEKRLQQEISNIKNSNRKKKSFANNDVLKIFNENFDIEKEKKILITNLDYLKSLSVEEFTFRKKWEEIQEKQSYLPFASKVKSLIWKPNDINDENQTIREIENLKPTTVLVKTTEHNQIWNTLRIYCHSADYNQAPGRTCRFLHYDEYSGKIIGFSSIASDVPTISCREKEIGWDRDTRIFSGRLNNSAIATTIASTQPFGMNFLGGKLIAILMTSSYVRNSWKKEYGDILAGMTTTSLYGSFSMYNGLKWWKYVGTSNGKILIKPETSIYKKWNEWLKINQSEKYNDKLTKKNGNGPVTSPKMKILEMMFRAAGIKIHQYVHGYQRGVYYSFFYENSKEFLCNKISEKELKLKPLISKDVEGIMEYWRPRAILRYKKLKEEGRLNPNKLFYSQMVDMSYEKAKCMYFKDVGR